MSSNLVVQSVCGDFTDSEGYVDFAPPLRLITMPNFLLGLLCQRISTLFIFPLSLHGFQQHL